jgi:hypothetical protein
MHDHNGVTINTTTYNIYTGSSSPLSIVLHTSFIATVVYSTHLDMSL